MTINRLITTLVQILIGIPAIIGVRYIIQDIREGGLKMSEPSAKITELENNKQKGHN